MGKPPEKSPSEDAHRRQTDAFPMAKRSKTPLNHHVPDRPSNNPLGIIQKGNTSTAQNELRGVAELG
ncbi:hypothetical protein TNIN_167021 [Trichonephila inaurata madagascariensis]|uniref:Uncharacterized protein n=1 Tax=Trichonephila inaurata madagascariensis TaxID=2747483 RepID=A0A8X6WSX0_9ARAC|nr:hypothetical protein TNIN_167021 [Trichonephila inaurata madagascariensis]